jgi:hypothetical protein
MINLFIILCIFILFFVHAYSLEFRKFTKYDGILSIGLLIIAVISTLNLILNLIN